MVNSELGYTAISIPRTWSPFLGRLVNAGLARTPAKFLQNRGCHNRKFSTMLTSVRRGAIQVARSRSLSESAFYNFPRGAFLAGHHRISKEGWMRSIFRVIDVAATNWSFLDIRLSIDAVAIAPRRVLAALLCIATPIPVTPGTL